MRNHVRSFKTFIRDEIIKKGGWVNAHAHADRAFTMTPEKIGIYHNSNLQQKWDLVDEVKRTSSVDDYYARFCQSIELMISQGVTAFGTFVDIDPICEDRAIIAAHKAREVYKHDIILKFANQTLKGVIEPEARKWFDIGSDMVDMIGGLPYRDELDYGRGLEAMDILLDAAKSAALCVMCMWINSTLRKKKKLNSLCDKTIEHGMEGRVVAIHGISIGAHSKEYRYKLYEKMRQAKMMMIACPMAWIDSNRKEDLMPFHNALTPADEMIPEGITVALGTDNICDYMVPLCEGDLWQELSLLAAGCRFPHLDAMVDIASINGRKVLGLEPV
ncbi:MAG: hypothetical protein ACLR5N_04910 [Haemophilus parainfluenzae]